MKIILKLLCVFAVANISFAQIIINEVASKNGGSHYDESNKTPDWIELYNPSDNDINLKDWRIFDKDRYDDAFALPDTTIAAKSYLLIYPSGTGKVTKDNFIVRSSGYGMTHYTIDDEFTFLNLPISSNFEMLVNLKAVKNSHPFDKAGLMFRESLTRRSKYWGVFGQSRRLFSYRFAARTEENSRPSDFSSEYNQNYPNAHLLIRRTADTLLTAITDSTGYIIEYKKHYYPAGKQLFAGIAVASVSKSTFVEAIFGKLYVNGSPYRYEDLNFDKVGNFPDGEAYYGGEIHTEFGLSSAGEDVYLWNSQGQLIDHLAFPAMHVDYSYGRQASDTSQYAFFDKPTPAAANTDGFSGILDEPVIKLPSGWYSSSQTITIYHHESDVEIYYTLNGSDVTKENGIKYNGVPFVISQNGSLRAKAFKDGMIPSPTATHTYFINEEFDLPVISIVADSLEIFGENGIFAQINYFRKIEIPVYFTFWENSSAPSYSSNTGMRLTGESSKYFEQKPFRLYARDRYGNDAFEYPFFGDRSLNAYDKLWLRTASNDHHRALIRDVLANSLMEPSESLAVPKSRACIVYINGDYRGIYFLKEFIDENFLEDKHSIPKETVNMLYINGYASNGSPKNYFDMVSHLSSIDMNDEISLSIINSSIDVDNLLDYLVIQMYSVNTDWALKNIKFWQSDSYDRKWRWMMHDLDLIFSGKSAASVDPFPLLYQDDAAIGILMNILFKNRHIREQFLNRAADLTNTILSRSSIKNTIDSLSSVIAKEVSKHFSRWNIEVNWADEINLLHDFVHYRIDHFRYHLTQEFGLDGYYRLNMNNSNTNAGYIKLNSLNINENQWSGYYFDNIPITLMAMPNSGYKFANWGNPLVENKQFTQVAFSDNATVTLNYSKDSNPTIDNLVINEIMYKSHKDFDSKDWVEIYNPNYVAVDLSNWVLKDDKDDNIFIIPNGSQIEARGYLVLAESIGRFKIIYPNVANVIGSFDFGLSSNGDQVRLFDPSGKLIDMVAYGTKSPWDENANGTGYSLELTDPLLDNMLASSWRASYEMLGTPGRRNSVNTSVTEQNDVKISIYPNPASRYAEIILPSIDYQNVTLYLLDISGRVIDKLFDGNLAGSGNMLKIDCSSLASGIYSIAVLIDDQKPIYQNLIVAR